MAAGDVTAYNKWLQAQADGDAGGALSSMPIDFNSDTLKLIILTDSHTPDTGDSSTQEHLDDISANEVTTGTSYTGPITLAAKTVTLSSGTTTFDFDDITISNDVGGGFTNGRYGVVFKDSGTPATSPLVYSIDFGSNRDITAGDLTIVINSSGAITWS